MRTAALQPGGPTLSLSLARSLSLSLSLSLSHTHTHTQALRKHTKEREMAQTGSRKRLHTCVEANFQKEKLLAEVLISAKAVTDSILPKFKYAKGIKPQDMKKHIETWDRCYTRYKQHLSNPKKGKPILGGSHSGKKFVGDKAKASSGKSGGGGGGGGGGGDVDRGRLS